jgi:AcrR family transcriptional regulator
MARPRTMTDDAILDATEQSIAEYGPTAFALDDVARRLGVSAQALIHRFGSKQALVLAVAERRGRHATAAMEAAADHGASPLRAMLDFFERRMRSRHYSRRAIASGLAFTLAGVSDDAIRPHIVIQVAAIRANLRAFIAAAVTAGELHGEVDSIATLVEAVYNGALYLWLVDRHGTAWSYFEPTLNALLAPYRTATHRPRGRGAHTRVRKYRSASKLR